MAETNYISSIKTPDGKIHPIKDTDARKRMTEINYASLKSLRDNSKLIPGMQYRITDYHTITTQENTRSADNQFDIIVTADSVNVLNESARAIQHSGDTYFSNCNLAAWKIWYCLDNDTSRFAWADDTNGKGVIYRIIDEWNNDCPYDFKNIQFKRYKITKANQSDLVGTYLGLKENNAKSIEIDANDNIWCYTFTAQVAVKTEDDFVIPNNAPYIDGSLESPYRHMGDDSSTYHDNKIGSYLITYDDGEVPTLCGKYYLPDNVFIGYFESTTNAVADDFCCAYCSYNIALGNNCNSNSFGNDCYSNSFGNGCSYNSFGNNCYSNSFGNDCYHNKLNDYYTNNKFENGVQYVEFSGVGTRAANVQNYHIKQGMIFTDNAKHTITAKTGLNYELTVAKQSDGTVVEYCEADLLKK